MELSPPSPPSPLTPLKSISFESPLSLKTKPLTRICSSFLNTCYFPTGCLLKELAAVTTNFPRVVCEIYPIARVCVYI